LAKALINSIVIFQDFEKLTLLSSLKQCGPPHSSSGDAPLPEIHVGYVFFALADAIFSRRISNSQPAVKS